MPTITPKANKMSPTLLKMPTTLELTRLTVIVVTAWLALTHASFAADLVAGEALADEQCGDCHALPAGSMQIGQARDLVAVVQTVDWTHMLLREWFATSHPVRMSFQLTDKDLHDLRYYLMDLRDKSLLGTLGQP